jgi:hypothetical protein
MPGMCGRPRVVNMSDFQRRSYDCSFCFVMFHGRARAMSHTCNAYRAALVSQYLRWFSPATLYLVPWRWSTLVSLQRRGRASVFTTSSCIGYPTHNSHNTVAHSTNNSHIACGPQHKDNRFTSHTIHTHTQTRTHTRIPNMLNNHKTCKQGAHGIDHASLPNSCHLPSHIVLLSIPCVLPWHRPRT